jgi:hypothetical protein
MQTYKERDERLHATYLEVARRVLGDGPAA